MGIREVFGLSKASEVLVGEVADPRVAELSNQLEFVQERLLDLQREDRGWESLSSTYNAAISREALTRNADLVRIMSTLNPLMKRGKALRAGYVFGQGVEISVRDDEDNPQGVDQVAQAFLQEESNQDAVFGEEARVARENDLFDDGNVFIAHFVDPLTGAVTVRPVPFDEITDIITAPGDKFTPHYYRRTWTEQTPRAGYADIVRERSAYYPALKYQPLTRPQFIGETEVMWPGTVGGCAIYHQKVNPVGRDRKWGVGDGFAAMPWARAYKEFLEDWAMLMKALSRIAGVFKDKAGKSQALRSAVQQAQMGPAGGMAYTANGEVEFPSKSGATLDSESGRPIASMAAAAMGLPVTILAADPGTTGARAVAETLDLPTRLEMEARQRVHAEFYRASVNYALEQAVLAPRGPLRGKVIREFDRVRVVFVDDVPPTIEVAFPPLDQVDMKTWLESVNIAAGLNLLPPLSLLKVVAGALKLPDISDLIDEVTDDDGNFIPPGTTVADAAGTAAADALRNGEDPAAIL